MSLTIKRYPDLAGPFWFYQNTEKLWFSKKNWLYLRELLDGTLEPLSGVTGTVHIIDHSQPLMSWAVKMALQRVLALMQDHRRADGFYELYYTELEAILAAAKKADREELEEAGDIGHIAHDWIEQLIQSIISNDEKRTLEILAKLPEDERASNCCIAAVEWMIAHNVRWVSTERRVYSKKYGYAGTLDGLAWIDSCDDPMCCKTLFKDRLSLTDWKTSNYLYIEYLLQTAAYWNAVVEETGEAIQDRWIIRLGKEDAEFDPWHAEGPEAYEQDFAAFMYCHNLKHALNGINTRLGDIKEARKQLIAAQKLAKMKIKCPKADGYQGKRLSKCFDDGTQCQACAEKYLSSKNEKKLDK